MKSITLLTTAALVSVATLNPSFAQSVEIKFGSDKCRSENAHCVRFIGPMTDEELRAAGWSMDELDKANELVDLRGAKEAPANMWFATASTKK
ncbi:hypothetical protein [Sedimentitalea sp.]|uniref:hypothetical protein n=1 Tax=Sedimentitalea sp. TaxID=2048915 RepID=UPI0032998ED7